MKRPVAFTALCLAGFLAVLFTAGRLGVFVVAAASFLIAAVILICGRNNIRTALARCVLLVLCMLFAFVLHSSYTARQEKAVAACTGRGVSLEILITSKTAYSSSVLYKGNIISADGRPVKNITARFFSEGTYDPGDEVILRGTASVYSHNNGGNVDLNCEAIPENELKTGINETLLTGSTGKTSSFLTFEIPIGPSKTIIGRAIRFKYSCREAITDWLGGQEGALCVSLITGDRTLLSEDTLLNFERAGISHILAVSGLHVSVILNIFCGILKKLRIKGFIMLLVTAAAAFLISLFYGFTPSVVRACVMAVIGFAAGGFIRRNDPLTTMSIAALAVLIPEPAVAVSSSFLLSFGCTFALAVVNPAITERLGLGKTADKILSPFILTVSVNIVILPLLMLLGMNVSLAAVLAGPAVVLLTSLLIPALPLFILFSSLSLRFMSTLSALLCGLFAKTILKTAEIVSKWDFSSLALDNYFLRAGMLFSIVLIVLIIALKAPKPLLLSMLSLVVCITVSQAVFSALKKDSPVVTVYDSSTVIVTLNRESSVLFLKPSAKRGKYVESWIKSHIDFAPGYVIIPENSEYNIQHVAELEYYTNSNIVGAEEEVFPFDNANLYIKEFNGDIYLSHNDAIIVINSDDDLNVPEGKISMVIFSDKDEWRAVSGGTVRTFGMYDSASWLLMDNKLRRIG